MTGATGGGDVVDDGRRYVVDRTKPVDAEDDELKEDITGKTSIFMLDQKKLNYNVCTDKLDKHDVDVVFRPT